MYLAFERLLPRVRPQVHHKLRLDGKLVRAVLADVGLLGALRPLRPLLLLRALCEMWDEARGVRGGSGEVLKGVNIEDERRHGSEGRWCVVRVMDGGV